MRRHIILSLLALSLANLSLTSLVRAQDDPDPVKNKNEQPDEEMVPAQPKQIFPINDRMTDSQFEEMILGKDLASAKKFLESRLDWEITRTNQLYQLSPGQKKKLETAGKGSMKRLFDRVEEAKVQFQRAGGDFAQIGPLLQEFEPFQQGQHAYLFGVDSMFAKTLKNTLTPVQIATRAKTIYAERVEWMASLLDKPLGLKPDQHQRFVRLIVEETPPLTRYGSFDYDAVMYQTSRLPRDKIKSILDEAQLAKLLVRFSQADRMANILIGEGYIAKPLGNESARDAKDHSNRNRQKNPEK